MELVLIGVLTTIAFAFGHWFGKKEYDNLLQFSNSAIHTRDEVIADLQEKVKRHEEMRVTINEKANNFLREIQSHKEQEAAKKKLEKETKSKKKGKKNGK